MNRYFIRKLDHRYNAFQDATEIKIKFVIDLALKSHLKKHSSTININRNFRDFAMIQNKLFIFVDHDITSTDAIFIYYLLAQHSKILIKVRNEHNDVFDVDANSTASSFN